MGTVPSSPTACLPCSGAATKATHQKCPSPAVRLREEPAPGAELLCSLLCVCVCALFKGTWHHQWQFVPPNFFPLFDKATPSIPRSYKNLQCNLLQKKDVSAILSLRPCRPGSCTQYFRVNRTAAAVQRQRVPVQAERAPNTSVLCHQEAIWTWIVTISISFSRGVRSLSQAILLWD